MKFLTLTIPTILAILSIHAYAQVPYNTIPDWESNANGHVATGLGLADINGDGWKDIIAANGNDMARQRLVVYYNNGDGTFPLDPSWQSDDIDYHGHLSCGDIDQDGDIDVAVSVYIGPSGFNSPGKLKVYYNLGSELQNYPSFISNPFYTFSCALGDADGDGDLDIAAAAGEPYSELYDNGKIFINNFGTFSPDADWETSEAIGALDVEFGDVNLDGNLDVIFACESTDNYIYLGNPQALPSPVPSWHSTESENYINSVDVGYQGNPITSLVVMTGNNQLGGDGKVRMYDFSGGVPASSSASWTSNPFGYGSGILLADVNLDENLDLIYGGWWLPIKIALGNENGFELITSFTSQTNSVVEAIQMADLGRESIIMKTSDPTISIAGQRLIILEDQLVENIVSVMVDGIELPLDDYCHVANKNWVSLKEPLQTGQVVMVTYEMSPHPDMVITNWDNNKGNYIFFNTNIPIGISEKGEETRLTVFPNPAHSSIRITFDVPLQKGTYELQLCDLTGRVIDSQSIDVTGEEITVSLPDIQAGLYFLAICSSNFKISGKILIH